MADQILPSGAFPPMGGVPQGQPGRPAPGDIYTHSCSGAGRDSIAIACSEAFAAVDAAGAATLAANRSACDVLQSSGLANRGSVMRELGASTTVPDAGRGADDLMWKLSAWKQMAAMLYRDTPPVATVNVTVVAGASLPTAQPEWIAHVAGATAETGPPSAYHTKATGSAIPSPSWSGQPLSLPVHDLSADLCLLLCEPAADLPGGRRCVGRVFVPLTSLLPLNPFAAPKPLQAWCVVFPPAAEHAVDGVHPLLGAAVPGVAGLGMKPPPSGSSGKALVHVELVYNKSALGSCVATPVVGTYLFVPPFDAATVPSIDRHTQQPATPPEEIRRILYRLGASLRAPALLRLSMSQPLFGLPPVLGLLCWLSYFCPLPVLPTWLFAAWVLNGFALAWERRSAVIDPWEPSALDGSRVSDARPTTPQEKLEALQRLLLPLLQRIEASVITLERIAAIPAAADLRCTILLLLPAFGLCSLASGVLGIIYFVLWLFGGVVPLLFWILLLLLLLQTTFHIRVDGALSSAGMVPPRVSAEADDRALLPAGGAGSSGRLLLGRPYPRWLNTERREAVASTSIRVGGALCRCSEVRRALIWKWTAGCPRMDGGAVAVGRGG